MTTVLLRLIQDGRYRVTVELPSRRPYVNNLHHIVNQFREGGFDFWLSVDADNPPSGNPLDLVASDLDLVGFPTPIWHYTGKPGERPVYWNGYDYCNDVDAYIEHHPRQGLQRVDAIGTGCFLVARRVFEHPDLTHGAFFRTWNKDGTVRKGNDLAFCDRARRAGFEIWCHYDYPCNHYCELDLDSVVGGMRGLYEMRPTP